MPQVNTMLKVVVLTLLCAPYALGLTAADFKGKNVLIFLTDQERATQNFPAGWEEKNMPGLTRLKKNGLTFENAFTNACMCSPSRSTMLSGYFTAQSGVRYTLENNMPAYEYPQVEMPVTLKNIAHVMSDAGYNVVYKGKLHVDKPSGDNFTWVTEDAGKYGFTRWNPPDAGANQSLEEGGGNPEGGGDNDARFMNSKGSYESGNEGILQYISSVANQSQPFLMFASLVNPHDVLFYPNQFEASGYDPSLLDGDIQLPPTVNENLKATKKPTAQQQLQVILKGLAPNGTTEQINYINFYGNLIKKSDEYLVQILDALDAAGLTDDTIVIKTADHGEMGLSHGGLIQKNFNMYEESIKVPLVYSNPKLFPKPVVSQSLVSHVDMVPTFANLFEAPLGARADWSGVDYSPVILDPTKSVQDYTVFTYDDFQSGQANGPYPQPPQHVRAIREARYKFAQYYDASADIRKTPSQFEMYDLQTDPNEEVNLAAVKRTPEQEKEYQRLKKKLRDVQRTRLGPIPGFQQEVNITANTATKKTNGLEILDEGFTLGVPVAAGNITLNWVLDPKTSVADTKITIATEEGIIRGKASTTYTVNKSANSIKFVGTMNITSGTSAFRGIKATGLEFTDDNTLNGQNGKVTIKGVAHYV